MDWTDWADKLFEVKVKASKEQEKATLPPDPQLGIPGWVSYRTTLHYTTSEVIRHKESTPFKAAPEEIPDEPARARKFREE